MKRGILSRLQSGLRSSTPISRRSTVETLEHRTLLAAAPFVSNIISDNRGEVEITISGTLNASTVNKRSVMMHTAGADGILGNADDAKETIRVWWNPGNSRIRIRGKLEANTLYRIKLNSKIITGSDGQRLDGEFNGGGLNSGNGVAGGDCVFVSKPDKTTRPVARYSTIYGAVNVRLFKDLAPGTVANFMAYANLGSWDGTFIHRSVPGFVIQGGGFLVSKLNTMVSARNLGPITNEPGVSNTRGRIAMAKVDGDPNSATNQWFFNVGNNTGLDSANGGFTAFGELANDFSVSVMDQINGFGRVNAGGAFSELPVNDLDTVQDRGFLDPAADVVLIRRIAMVNKNVALQPV